MNHIYRVDAVHKGFRVRSFLVRDAPSAEAAAARVGDLAAREEYNDEPLYPRDCDLAVEPVEFEVEGIELL